MPSKIQLFLTAPPHLLTAARSTGFPLLSPAAHPAADELRLPGGQVLISSAISGGTLAWRLEDAVRRFGPGRIILFAERTAMDFPLPAPKGVGVPLSREALQDRLRRLSPAVFFSQALCAQYFVYRDTQSMPRFVLFDDRISFRRKLTLARSLGITTAAVSYPQVCGWLEEIKGWEEISSQPETVEKPQRGFPTKGCSSQPK